MIFLPELGAQVQITLARQLASSLVSIVADDKSRVYFGDTTKVTSVSNGYDYLIVLLGIVNTSLVVLTTLLRRRYEEGIYVNVLSPLSMFSLAVSYMRGDEKCNKPVEKGVILGGVERGYGWDVRKVLEDTELVARNSPTTTDNSETSENC